MPREPLILASASPRRVALLKEMGLEFKVQPARVIETQAEFLTPREAALHNALAKARSVSLQHPTALVIGADTIVTLDRLIFGKPKSMDQAAAMLGRLQGRSHLVITGVCLNRHRPFRRRLFGVSTEVIFKEFSRRQADTYLQKIYAFDKAGAYAIQEHGELIIDAIRGSYSNVVGLPVEQLAEELAAWGIPRDLW